MSLKSLKRVFQCSHANCLCNKHLSFNVSVCCGGTWCYTAAIDTRQYRVLVHSLAQHALPFTWSIQKDSAGLNLPTTTIFYAEIIHSRCEIRKSFQTRTAWRHTVFTNRRNYASYQAPSYHNRIRKSTWSLWETAYAKGKPIRKIHELTGCYCAEAQRNCAWYKISGY